MRGAGVHFAPSGAIGIEIFHGVSLFTSIVNASERPSGDQLRFEGFSLTCVTCDVAPSASIQRTKTWVPIGEKRDAGPVGRPAGIGALHQESVLRAVGIHDPQTRIPAVVDLVHPATR